MRSALLAWLLCRIAQGLTDLEADGLEKLETGACDVFSGGAGAPFCSMLFDNPIASWINNEIVNIPIVHKFTYWCLLPACETSYYSYVCMRVIVQPFVGRILFV